MVYFVGAGPGAADLITVRGQRYLEQADVIIYAGSLVNPELLKAAKKECRIYNSAYMDLDEVIAVLEKAQADGLLAVRLHTGDPSVYGAIREQMDALRERGIAFEVCPGVSSLFGASAALQIEYTLPEVSQTVILSRAEGRTPVPERESICRLATHQATMVLFLSSGLAAKVQRELLAGGYPPETPVAVAYKATWPEEKLLRSTLLQFADEMEREGIDKTALIVVGDILGGQYARSKLYDASFTTGFRDGRKDCGEPKQGGPK
ncbi:MAG: precorrin-4 C(11)-methyltransferase [Clostridiaceae bacterium]|nr:precorrin-4 C(11)-methyltransferase [Clostridiaceae bacterium]